MLKRLRTALELRNSLNHEKSNAFRLVDGTADGFANLEIDDFAGRWLVQTRDRDLPHGLAEAAVELGARSVYWKRLEQGDKQAPTYLAGERVDERFEILENGLRYWIDFDAGYSQGIFLDQRHNRARLQTMVADCAVLNTFAYTCAFGVCAAAGEAKEVVNLDLSKNYLAWGNDNFALNGFGGDNYDFIYGDTFDWLGRFAKRGRTFDIVILDPPTFSRDAKGRVFSVRGGYERLVRMACAVLNPAGTLLCSTNYRALDARGFQQMLRGALADYRAVRFMPMEMPQDFRGEAYLKSLFVSLPAR